MAGFPYTLPFTFPPPLDATLPKPRATLFTGTQSPAGTLGAAVKKPVAAAAAKTSPAGSVTVTARHLQAALFGAALRTGTIAAAGHKPSSALAGAGTRTGTIAVTGRPTRAALTGREHPRGALAATVKKLAAQLSNPEAQPQQQPPTAAVVTAEPTPLQRWQAAVDTGDPAQVAAAARDLTEAKSKVDTTFRFSVYDFLWRKVGEIGNDLIEASGTDPRNNVGTAKLVIKGNSPLVDTFAACRTTMVGVIVETGGLRWAFYVKTHHEVYDKGAWTHEIELKHISDVLNYMVIWPSWWLPIMAQPFSHAWYLWGLQTVCEAMVTECSMRLQLGLWEFVNNAGSLNLDIRSWFGTILQALARDGLSLDTFRHMLTTPIYVSRTNPFLDTSPVVSRTVRMQTCGEVIRDITKAYGVDTRMELWMPGDPQPDRWAHLDVPTYVFSTKDRSQIEGPTKTVLDSVLKTVVDLGGSLGGIFSGLAREIPGFDGQFDAPLLGVHFVAPWAILVAPDHGQDSSILSARISHHTPEGWQHIIVGRSPKWLNDLLNAFYSWIIDAIMILLGFTGVPSDLLAGFLNNAFLAFQLVEHYDRRNHVGPYHPAIERFHPTASSPYNIETMFAFINALFDSRGYTSAQVVFRNGDQYALGRDIFKGGLMSLVYRGRTRMITDYIENIMWRITPEEREVLVQLGDGRKEEAPLAKIQRLITGIFEGIAVLTLSPQN